MKSLNIYLNPILGVFFSQFFIFSSILLFMTLDKEVKEKGMAHDLEEIMKANGGISLWNMDIKNYIWNKKFYEGYDNLLNFVKEAEENKYFQLVFYNAKYLYTIIYSF